MLYEIFATTQIVDVFQCLHDYPKTKGVFRFAIWRDETYAWPNMFYIQN